MYSDPLEMIRGDLNLMDETGPHPHGLDEEDVPEDEEYPNEGQRLFSDVQL